VPEAVVAVDEHRDRRLAHHLGQGDGVEDAVVGPPHVHHQPLHPVRVVSRQVRQHEVPRDLGGDRRRRPHRGDDALAEALERLGLDGDGHEVTSLSSV
jgi:hypothetical protein